MNDKSFKFSSDNASIESKNDEEITEVQTKDFDKVVEKIL